MESLEEFKKNNKLTWMRRVFDPRNYTFSSKWISVWNTHVNEIMKNSTVIIRSYLSKLMTFFVTTGGVKLIEIEPSN